MANESSKTKRQWGELERSVLQGEGIDIGCGTDPVLPGVMPFDLAHGDANEIRATSTGSSTSSTPPIASSTCATRAPPSRSGGSS